VSLTLIFTYYLLLTFGQNLGERGALSPVLASWLPNALLSVIAAVLLVRAASGNASTRLGTFQGRWWFLRTRFAPRSSW
jgi:hypothetical protein